LLGLFAVFFFCVAGGDLDVVVDDSEFAALILKRVGDGVEFTLDLRNLVVNLADLRLNTFQCSLRFRL